MNEIAVPPAKAGGKQIRFAWSSVVARALVALSAVYLLVPPAEAQEDVPKSASLAEAPRHEDVTVRTGLRWLSDAQCVSCHFQVPRQAARQSLEAALVKKGYLAEYHLAEVHKQPKGQQCADCHDAANDPHGQCTRGEGCLRNVGSQKKVTYLGVSVSAVPQALRQHVKLPVGVGLIIENVEPNSPAAQAELRRYDILRRLDRQLLVNQEQFSALVKMYPPEHEVSVELIRANETKKLSVKLGERVVDDAVALASEAIRAERDLRAIEQAQTALVKRIELDLQARIDELRSARPGTVTYLGVNTSPPPDPLAEQLKLPKGLYLVIDSVESDSPAAAAGLRPFDVLQQLDDQLLVNSEQLTVLIRNHRTGDEVGLTLIREGQPLTIRAKLGEHQVGDTAVAHGTAVADLDGDGALDLSVATFELVNDKLSNAVDLSMSGSDVKDEDFVRRIYLDLAGTLPSAKEVAEFAADGWPNKRQRLVDRLLSRPEVIGRLGGSAVLQWSDDEHSLLVTKADAGQRRLVARDKQGNVLFDGPVDSDNERRQLDKRLAAKLELMLKGLEATPAGDSPADAAAALEKVLPRFHADAETLAQLLDRLRRDTGANIVVDRKALLAIGIKLDEPMSIDLRDVRARSVLKTLLALAGGPNARLTHEVDDGVVLITTAR